MTEERRRRLQDWVTRKYSWADAAAATMATYAHVLAPQSRRTATELAVPGRRAG